MQEGLMLTVKALRSQMEASGRDFPKRKVKDWLSKGLLPRPHRPGLGQGPGRPANSWSNPRVLGQARNAYDLLDLYPRTEFARLGLWLLGYDVELRHVRSDYDTIIEQYF